jgi:heat-inducible transcriptional repressor
VSNEDLPALMGRAAARERLTARQEAILRAVVDQHVATGAPVGSKNIAGREGIDFASSTVRYELARLEELRYLDHPHTSAGRVPTDRGYRYYVDVILGRGEPAPPEAVRTIADALDAGQVRREVDAALRRLADVMSQLTNLLGMVTAPPPYSATIRHVEVLVLQPQLVMVVVITSTGLVTKRMFVFERSVDSGMADWAAEFFNEHAAGLTVGARIIGARLTDPKLRPAERTFIDALAPALTELEEESTLYVSGQGRLLAEHRVRDVQEIERLMGVIEQRYALLSMLRGALARNQLYLLIGEELSEPGLRGLSLVAANYGVARRNLGTVSILGPTRMDYRLAISTVREAAQALSEYVEGVYE